MTLLVDRWKSLVSRSVEFFIAEIDTYALEIPETAIVEMEQALVVMFLQSAPNNYDHLLNGTLYRTASWQVRRVEEYIEANWQKPITIEILAAEANARPSILGSAIDG